MNYVEIEPSGRIVQCGSAPFATLAEMPGADPVRFKVVANLPADLNACYWDGDGVRAMSPRPSEHHDLNYEIRQWELNVESAWRAVRLQRDRLLARTDWVALRAADQGEPVPPEWLAYRQALRDVTEQQDPLNIVWPVAPAA